MSKRLNQMEEWGEERYQAGLEAGRQETAVLRAQVEQLRSILQDCIDGVNCQPGYIRSITIQQAQAALAEKR